MHASLVSSRGDGESPEIQKLTAWDTCPTLGNRVSLSHLSIRKADRKHVAAAVQKTTFLHDRQQHPAQRGGRSVRPHATPRDRRAQNGAPNAAPSYRSHQIVLRSAGTIALQSPATTRADDGRNAIPRYGQSLAAGLFASFPPLRSAVCASSSSRRS